VKKTEKKNISNYVKVASNWNL